MLRQGGVCVGCMATGLPNRSLNMTLIGGSASPAGQVQAREETKQVVRPTEMDSPYLHAALYP